ncbi:hypothetical protein P691DRAFT_224094 [Macrolepiota fuliginosa MF-IS2]|uniref:Uncharacterized protein n=1 Tax=Macrolepiota fuliginosa MF-IS2 TaxID=1400762 RepID=A0A9P6C1Z3_9AGAR|nr:hypothetical protein P691DRAFT_224094 [Macrolepiota fuliginosa MF-IS2]
MRIATPQGRGERTTARREDGRRRNGGGDEMKKTTCTPSQNELCGCSNFNIGHVLSWPGLALTRLGRSRVTLIYHCYPCAYCNGHCMCQLCMRGWSWQGVPQGVSMRRFFNEVKFPTLAEDGLCVDVENAYMHQSPQVGPPNLVFMVQVVSHLDGWMGPLELSECAPPYFLSPSSELPQINSLRSCPIITLSKASWTRFRRRLTSGSSIQATRLKICQFSRPLSTFSSPNSALVPYLRVVLMS